MASFVLSCFPLDVLDEIWDLIESVSEGFLIYSYDLSFVSESFCLICQDVSTEVAEYARRCFRNANGEYSKTPIVSFSI